MAQTNFPTQDKATSLYGSGVSIGETSVKLSALTDIYGNVLTMADIGLKGFGTMEPGTNNEEAITFSGITVNADGTSTITGIKSVLAKPPFTETTGFLRSHFGGTRFVISNTGAFYNDLVAYVNGVVVGGAQDASTTVKGITKLNVAPTSPTDPIAVGTNDVATTGASKVIRSKANSLIDDSLLGLTTAGDIVYSDGTDLARLPKGTTGDFLTAGATAPQYTTYANLPEANTFFGGTDITSVEAEYLTDSSTINTLHFHKKTFGTSFGNGATTQTIAHGLGVVPKRIRIKAIGAPNAATLNTSEGIFDGTTYAYLASEANNGASNYTNGTNKIIYQISTGVNASAALDATLITLTWSSTSNGGITFLWEAEV